MDPEIIEPTGSDLSAEACDEMAKYGITRARINHFFYGGFRYTNLRERAEKLLARLEAG